MPLRYTKIVYRGGIFFSALIETTVVNVYLSKNVLNKMDDDAVFSFKFWPREQEVNVDVVVHVK